MPDHPKPRWGIASGRGLKGGYEEGRSGSRAKEKNIAQRTECVSEGSCCEARKKRCSGEEEIQSIGSDDVLKRLVQYGLRSKS